MSMRPLLAFVLAAAGIAGCASPREHYYSLVPDVSRVAAAAGGPVRAVAIAAVTVPEAVNRPQLVIGSGDFERSLLEQERWVEPVAEDLQRAIAQYLSAQLAGTSVLLGGERGADSAPLQVFVQVRRFDMSPVSGVRLDAHWLILDKGAQPVREDDFSASVRASVRAGAQGYPALVRAQSGAVGSLAAQIAAALQQIR